MTTSMAQPGLAPDINLFEAMDIFKNFPDEELPKYKNDPKLALVAAAEMDRRLRIRKDFESKAQKPAGPVVDQLQQQLLAPPQGIAQGMPEQMGQPMQQPMGQPQEMQEPQEMQQPQGPQQQGLGALVPGMASGGPVAFQFGGGVGMEFGGNPVVEEEKEIRVPAIINGQRIMATPSQLRAAGYPESTIQQRVKEASPKPAPPQVNTLAQQVEDPKKTSQDALIAAILAGRQPTSSAVAAPAAPSLAEMAKKAQDYIPEINPPMSPEERRKIEDEEQIRMQNKFPDKVSPIMEELAKASGQQVDPGEARRRAFMKAGIAGLGYQGRDFGGGLAGMLEGYQNTKESIEAANKEAKLLELKARLASEQYKDALKRKDFESAKKYAQEMAVYKEQAVEARNQYKKDTLGVMAAIQQMTTPKKVAGAGEAKGALTPAKYADIREKAIERAKPDIDQLDQEFKKRTQQMFWSDTSLPEAWRTGTDAKSKKAQVEYETRRKQIIDKHANDVFDALRAASPLTITKEQVREMLQGKK
jgi:hypothetical protein